MRQLVPISDAAFDVVLKVLEGVMFLSVKFKLGLRDVLFETVFDKGCRILQSGRVQEHVWLLLTGLVREIRLDELSLQERTSWFWMEGDLLCTCSGFFSQDPAEHCVEVLERSRVVLISYLHWHGLMESFGETELLTEKLRAVAEKARRLHAVDVKNLAADDRYLSRRGLLELLFTRTKQKYVAEMMGMAPDTLGKLKSKYSNLR